MAATLANSSMIDKALNDPVIQNYVHLISEATQFDPDESTLRLLRRRTTARRLGALLDRALRQYGLSLNGLYLSTYAEVASAMDKP